MDKKYNLLIIISIFVVVLIGIANLFYINLKANESIEVEATVKLLGNDYIVVQDDNGKKYSLTINEEYDVGDRVDFLIKNPKDGNEYIEGTLVKIETISENINFSIVDDNNDAANNLDANSFDTNTNSTNIESSTNNKNSLEDNIVNYFTTLDNKLDTYEQDKSVGESLKKGFVTVVDFLFYDGQIKGRTFDGLSSTAKIKVLQIALSIDKKIEKYFPNYKEMISTTSKDAYSNVKTQAIKLYLDITTQVCQENVDVCESAKQGLSDMKDSFSITWDFIKEAGSVGLSKLKAWYEIWKNC